MGRFLRPGWPRLHADTCTPHGITIVFEYIEIQTEISTNTPS